MGNYYSLPQLNKYGWKPDLPDHRDKIMKFPRIKNRDIDKLPSRIDLRDELSPISDQGKLGSSTVQAVVTAWEFNEMKESNGVCPSKLFIYYNDRKKAGSIDKDGGSTIRDCIKSINRDGVCPESMWKYDVTQFAVKPPKKCYDDAIGHKSIDYYRLYQYSAQLKQALHAGYPIVFGMSIFESFESTDVAKTGIIPLPKDNEKLLGGHAVLLVGYDDEEGYWICRNSFGEHWGDKGYFYLPIEYLMKDKKLASDFWVLKRREETLITRSPTSCLASF